MKVLEEINEKCCSYCESECDGCWLKELITDHDKQVRKEVCEQIGRKIAMIANRQPNHDIGFDCEDMQISYLEVASVLNQIQGESNAKD